MGRIALAGIVPHPPLIIPAIGRKDISRVEATVKALKTLSSRVAEVEPDTVVIITPHGPVFQDRIALMGGENLEGDFGNFGAPEVAVKVPNNLELCQLIQEEAEAGGINTVLLDKTNARLYGLTREIDHGALVPLYYLQEAGVRAKVVHITFGLLPYLELFAFGRAVRAAVEKQGINVVLVASGDLSHRLIKSAPAGYHPRAAEFDRQLVKLLGEYRVEEIFKMDRELIELAGECGFRSIIIALGALDGYHVQPEVLSYEGPFGVGYLVASFVPSKGGEEIYPLLKEKGESVPEKSEPARLARKSLEYYLKHKKIYKPEFPLAPEMKGKAGAFVSIKKEGQLRGCIGTIQPTKGNLADEIINNAISAGLEDPRFPPVSPEELDSLTFSVDILSPLEKVEDISALDPKRFGVLVRAGGRSGLLLPDLEGVDTVEQQLAIARQKAGIRSGEKYEIYRFTVKRYR